MGPRAADLDLAPGRRHRRRAGRHHRVARPRSALRGLYLGIVTSAWCSSGSTSSTRAAARSSGPAEVGRDFPALEIRCGRRRSRSSTSTTTGTGCGSTSSGTPEAYLFFALAAARRSSLVVARTSSARRTGRALQAIRDRDIAAEVMGVPEVRYKLIAFAISLVLRRRRRRAVRVVRRQAPAGVLEPGPVGRVHRDPAHRRGRHRSPGTLLGTFFVVLSPRLVEEFAALDGRAGRRRAACCGDFWDVFVSSGAGDFGFGLDGAHAPGFALTVFDSTPCSTAC